MDLLDIGPNWNDRVLAIAFAYRAREIFFNGNEFAEIDAAALIDDAEPADAEHLFQAPLAKDCAGGQCLVAIRLAQRRLPLNRSPDCQ